MPCGNAHGETAAAALTVLLSDSADWNRLSMSRAARADFCLKCNGSTVVN